MQTTTQKIAMWIVDNIPCRKFAPFLFRYSIGAIKWREYNNPDIDKIYKFHKIKKKFKNGDWFVSVGDHKYCGQIYTDENGNFQPFFSLNDVNPNNYRSASEDEIIKIKKNHKGNSKS